ncbi:unnamed protein product [Rotaria sp. Silwood1]|nr:unnamed protein product [Rotaria sp. Silwood1]CAF1404972.1 unnamed protein product [Rotaria sp. Silwood1]CAF1408266.1 unnamed protein product [Rotaria sp. Silwood1]CAF3561269.1 unnamed protein product [Rotaria sp. Silwood1]CAF3576574.1 unnamed protein product [Rotaria sp. Silwood1]
METSILELPNELIEIIIFYIIGRPWKNDVHDFLSFTSTCRYFRRFIQDERYWRIMTLRRDPTCEKTSETIKWFEHCKQIYCQRTISGDELKQCISRYNDNYFCTIEKIFIWPNKIRVYIDEHGDESFGNIRDPTNSIIALVDNNFPIYSRPIGIRTNHSKFSIANERSEHLGYLDFPYSISLNSIGKNLIFQYGISGYTNAILFHIDRTFINKYNLVPLFRKLKKIPKHSVLFRTKSI